MTVENNPDSRAKVLGAACAMFGEDPTTTLSVRSVAARAGVSMGSLRHHFPTQRALRDAVLEAIYDATIPTDDVIHDRSIPPHDRLVQCMRQVLAPTVGDRARTAWLTFFENYVAPEPTDALRAAYTALAAAGERRIEHWLTVLAAEGALRDGDPAVHASVLSTVLTGLSIERAFPTEHSALQRETAVLAHAAASVLK